MVTVFDNSSLSSLDRASGARRSNDSFADRSYRSAFLEPQAITRPTERPPRLGDEGWERDRDERRSFRSGAEREPSGAHFDSFAAHPTPIMATWDELELRREFGLGDPFEVGRVSRRPRSAILDDGAVVRRPGGGPASTDAFGSDLRPADLSRIARRPTPPLAFYTPDLNVAGYPEFVERSRVPVHGGIVVVRFSDRALAAAGNLEARRPRA